MTVEEDVVDLLKDAGLTIYPGFVPEKGSYPCVVIQVIANTPIRSHSGNVMEKHRVQLSCWAKTWKACVETAATVKSVMDLNQTDFKLSIKESELDLPAEDEPGYFHRAIDFFVWT